MLLLTALASKTYGQLGAIVRPRHLIDLAAAGTLKSTWRLGHQETLSFLSVEAVYPELDISRRPAPQRAHRIDSGRVDDGALLEQPFASFGGSARAGGARERDSRS